MEVLKNIQRRIFPSIIALSALSVSASAAFYSVTGLSKLFAGASFQVLIMAGSLEVAKLVIASLLYQYWGELNKILRTYLSIATVVLVLITSAGIYGFLSAAYQETATKSGIVDKEIELLELKKSRFVENRDYLLTEKSQLDEGINSLREGLANNVIQYKDQETGQIITTTSGNTRRALQAQLETATEQRNEVSKKLEVATDSITSIEVRILNVESSSELSGELGPLKYLSNLTGKPMDNIINILLLVIIFVFDPLAISLVIAANFAFDKLNGKKEEEDIIDEKEPKPLTLSNEELEKLQVLLNNKTHVIKEDTYEPDAEQEVLVDEEEINEEDLIDEDYYKWEKESAEELHLKDIEDDFEEDIVFSRDNDNEDGYWTEEEMADFRNQFDSENELGSSFDDNVSSEDSQVESEVEDTSDKFDEDHALDMVMNDMVKDLTDEDISDIVNGTKDRQGDDYKDDGQYYEHPEQEIQYVKDPEDKLEELKKIDEQNTSETTTIFEEEDEDLGEDTTYEDDLPKRKAGVSPYLRVGNKVIPRNVRYRRGK